MAELQQTLNTLAGTTGLDAQGAANVWAGTTGKDLLGALNYRAGRTGLGVQGVLNALSGTTGNNEGFACDALLAGRLSANDSGLETSVGNWVNNGNAAVAQSATQAYAGTKSLRLTSVAAGDMSAIIPAASATPVVPGQMTSISAQFRASTVGRQCIVRFVYWDVALGFLLTGPGSTFPTSTTTGWVQATSVNSVAPASAAWASAVVQVVSTAAASEIHYVDQIIVT